MSKMIKKMLLAGLLLTAVVAPVQEVKAMDPLLDFCASLAAVFTAMKVLDVVDKKTNLYANVGRFRRMLEVNILPNGGRFVRMFMVNKYNPIFQTIELIASGDSRMETINPM